mmetsp:Transcript_11983/g.34638  ORF Transcript_11983/g.34638 Transcript_11983/m.34638 type:complete len:250 (+) Transcript_11983:1504-2253(+)
MAFTTIALPVLALYTPDSWGRGVKTMPASSTWFSKASRSVAVLLLTSAYSSVVFSTYTPPPLPTKTTPFGRAAAFDRVPIGRPSSSGSSNTIDRISELSDMSALCDTSTSRTAVSSSNRVMLSADTPGSSARAEMMIGCTKVEFSSSASPISTSNVVTSTPMLVSLSVCSGPTVTLKAASVARMSASACSRTSWSSPARASSPVSRASSTTSLVMVYVRLPSPFTTSVTVALPTPPISPALCRAYGPLK